MSKFLDIYATLNKQEKSTFKKFIRAEFINSNKSLVSLCEQLTQKKNAGKVTRRREIWEKIWPDQPLNEGVFRARESLLTKFLEQFLMYQQLSEPHNSVLRDRLLAREFMDRNLDKYFNSQFKTSLKKTKSSKIIFTDDLNELFLLKSDKNIVTQRQTASHAAGTTGSLKELWEADSFLNRYFLVHKLRTFLSIVRVTETSEHPPNTPMKAFIMEYLKTAPERNDPLINIYYLSIQLWDADPSEKAFSILQQTFVQHIDEIEHYEGQQLLFNLLNFTLHSYLSGGPSFLEEAFELHQLGLDRTLLLDSKGIMILPIFNSIVHLGLRLKKVEFIESFIQKYHLLLPKKTQKNATHYAKALLAFNLGKYSSVHRHLSFIRAEGTYKIHLRMLKIKVAYETKKWEDLEKQIMSTEKYLQRLDDGGSEVIHPQLIRVRLIRRIINITDNISPKAKKLLKDIQHIGIIDQDWLFEKFYEKKKVGE